MGTWISMVRVGTVQSFIGTFALMSSVREKRIAVSIRRLNHGGMLNVRIGNKLHSRLLQTQLDSGIGFGG